MIFTMQPAHFDTCVFCGSSKLRQTHRNLYHTFKTDHGPFDFHQCEDCGSGLSLNPPSAERLGELYSSYKDGLPELHREIMQDDSQSDLYEYCARRMLKRVSGLSEPSWIDVGAGGGELSAILAKLLPRSSGRAIDLHARPERLAAHTSVEWIQCDINEDGFASKTGLANSADMVISTAVWEHVLRPDFYARDLLRLLKPGGVLYLMCPNYGSAARILLGNRWPYFTPGEHLNMPTPKGAKVCLSRQWKILNGERNAPAIHAAPIALPYSFRYVFRRFRLDAIGKLISPRIGVPLPAGALEAVVVLPHQ